MENGFEIGEVLGIQSSLIRKTGVFKGGWLESHGGLRETIL